MMYPSLRTPGIAACEVGGFDVVQPINIRNNSLVTHMCMYIQGITTHSHSGLERDISACTRYDVFGYLIP
jgi:hypothetical protein